LVKVAYGTKCVFGALCCEDAANSLLILIRKARREQFLLEELNPKVRGSGI